MPPTVHGRIKVLVGDITALRVDAIVNAANEALIGGSGVDGTVHRAAGPALYKECRAIGYCPEGEARITKGYLLPAKFIIHAVGPVWEGGGFGEAELLSRCYRESLALAASHDIQTIAFPCIATGGHEFPPDKACDTALATTFDWLAGHELPREVTFCCFSPAEARAYQERLAR
jgi:O-acetyl-ADP-ribose deacetylase (regulator of RNase III)